MSLFASLNNVTDGMRTLQRSIDVISGNVTNASTPGYARQRLRLAARAFHPDMGDSGGVEARGLLSGRRQDLELAVQDQAHKYGRYARQSRALEPLEAVFDVNSDSRIAGSINRLFQAFSQWSVSPNDGPLRQSVLGRAGELATTIRGSAMELAAAMRQAGDSIADVVGSVNEIGRRINQYNTEVMRDHRRQDDPGLEAQVYQAFDELSELVDFDAVRLEDGTYTVLIGGQTPLTIGGNLYKLAVDSRDQPARVLDSLGVDISDQIQGGEIRGLMDAQRTVLPSLMSGLDRLASVLADRVNGVLREGIDREGNTPTLDLFTYDSDLGAAASLRVTGLEAEQLAGALPGAPGGNGNALRLAELGTSREVDDYTFAQYYGKLAQDLGTAVSSAQENERTQELLLGQVREMREDASGVSLDEEAAALIAFQRAWQANAELVRVLNGLLDETINLIR